MATSDVHTYGLASKHTFGLDTSVGELETIKQEEFENLLANAKASKGKEIIKIQSFECYYCVDEKEGSSTLTTQLIVKY